ncbi:MAG TPA: hypothetical protein VLH19_04320 [Patescibacteria group bacterium]|nr:hypothetical protein [Patescibacteria group bacterium]
MTSTFDLTKLSLESIVSALKRRRYFTVALVSWIAMGVLSISVLIPQAQQILDVTKQIQSTQSDLDKAKTAAAFADSLSASSLQKELDSFNHVLPATKPIIPLLSSLERVAGNAQITITSFDVVPGKIATQGGTLDTTGQTKSTIPGLLALPLKLEVMGTFGNMNLFFQGLDEVAPLVHASSIQFAALGSNSKDASASAQFKAVVNLESLFIPDQPKKAVSGAIPVLVKRTPEQQAVVDRVIQLASQNEFVLPSVNASGSGRLNYFTF